APPRSGSGARRLLSAARARAGGRVPDLVEAAGGRRGPDRPRVRRARRRRGDPRLVDGRNRRRLGERLGDRAGAPRLVDPAGDVHRPDRGRARADDGARLGAARPRRAGALPRRLRLGERDAGEARADAVHRHRARPRQPDDRAPERAARRAARGDRVVAALLELRQVSLSFGGLRVVSNLDLVVREGEIVSLIGPNGAGKTTVFNLITGIYHPDEGEILLDGRDIAGLQPHRINELGVARTFQTLRLFLNMSVKENVMAAAYARTKAGPFRAMLR